MSTFTPGPWSIVPYGDGSSLVIHSDSDNRVCFMATASSDRPTSHAAIRANAALIAAAPALYEALKVAERALLSDAPHGPQKSVTGDDVIYHLDGQTCGHALQTIRAALSAAKQAGLAHEYV